MYIETTLSNIFIYCFKMLNFFIGGAGGGDTYDNGEDDVGDEGVVLGEDPAVLPIPPTFAELKHMRICASTRDKYDLIINKLRQYCLDMKFGVTENEELILPVDPELYEVFVRSQMYHTEGRNMGKLKSRSMMRAVTAAISMEHIDNNVNLAPGVAAGIGSVHKGFSRLRSQHEADNRCVPPDQSGTVTMAQVRHLLISP